MEVVILRYDRDLVVLLPLLVDDRQALGQTATTVLRRLTQLRQLPELFGPFFTAAPVGESAADPTEAVLLDDHQARFLAEEDLIGSDLFNASAADVIQDSQQGRAATAGCLAQAAELGHAGGLLFRARRLDDGLGHEDDQQTAANRKTDAFGLSRAGVGGEAVVIDEEGVGQEGLKFGNAELQLVRVVAEFLQLLLRVVATEGLQDGLGVALESLSAKPELAGALGNLAVGPVEHGVGVGDAEFGG